MRTLRLIIIWGLAASLISGAYLVSRMPCSISRLTDIVLAVARMESAANLNGTALRQVGSPFCAAGESYVLLSTPPRASFSMGAGPGADACMELGNADNRKLLLCRGNGPAKFPITVHDAANSRTYIVGLAPCNTKAPSRREPSAQNAGSNRLVPVAPTSLAP